jgi:hypothetical protein
MTLISTVRSFMNIPPSVSQGQKGSLEIKMQLIGFLFIITLHITAMVPVGFMGKITRKKSLN